MSSVDKMKIVKQQARRTEYSYFGLDLITDYDSLLELCILS